MLDSRLPIPKFGLPIPDSRIWTPDSRLLKEQKYYGNRNFRKYPSL